ncbi:MAG: hypothetical protein KBT03_04530 [Bacteroidales bacterium]|nr:hypothetical protein [Candidatus Scybalousia scybalohippi]
MRISNTSKRLTEYMDLYGVKQVDILDKAKVHCQKFGVKLTKSDLSQYVSGKVEPKQDKLFILGQALGVSETWLMGFDVPMRDSVPNKDNVKAHLEMARLYDQMTAEQQQSILLIMRGMVN